MNSSERLPAKVRLGELGPPEPACMVLSITELRERLDYADRNKTRVLEFHKSLHDFALFFRSTAGIRGNELRFWENSRHRLGFFELADSWYSPDGGGGGEFFWPNEPGLPNYNRLKHGRDEKFIMLHLMQLFYRINTARPNELGPFMHRDPQQKAPSMVQPQYGSINDPIDVDDDSQQSLPRPQEYSTASRAHEGNPNQGYSSVKLESQPEIQQQPEQQQQPEIQEQVTEELRSASTASDAFTFPDTPWPEPPQPQSATQTTQTTQRIVTFRFSSGEHLRAALKSRAKKSKKRKRATAETAADSEAATPSRRRRRAQRDPDVRVSYHDPSTEESATENPLPPREEAQPILHGTSMEGAVQVQDSQPAHTDGRFAPSADHLVRAGYEQEVSSVAPAAQSSEGLAGATTATAATPSPQFQDPRTATAKQPVIIESMEPVASVVDEHGRFIGPLRGIQPWNPLVQMLLGLPIQRAIKIRNRREFTAKKLDKLYVVREPRGIKWLSFMIQATGTIQARGCSSCQRGHGIFAECVFVESSPFTRCGCCEWNRHSCDALAFVGLENELNGEAAAISSPATAAAAENQVTAPDESPSRTTGASTAVPVTAEASRETQVPMVNAASTETTSQVQPAQTQVPQTHADREVLSPPTLAVPDATAPPSPASPSSSSGRMQMKEKRRTQMDTAFQAPMAQMGTVSEQNHVNEPAEAQPAEMHLPTPAVSPVQASHTRVASALDNPPPQAFETEAGPADAAPAEAAPTEAATRREGTALYTFLAEPSRLEAARREVSRLETIRLESPRGGGAALDNFWAQASKLEAARLEMRQRVTSSAALLMDASAPDDAQLNAWKQQMEEAARPAISMALPNEVAQASTKKYQAYVTEGSEGPETRQPEEAALPSSHQAAPRPEEPCQSDDVVRPCQSVTVVKPCQSDAVVQLCQSDAVVQAGAKEEKVRPTASPIATPRKKPRVEMLYTVVTSRNPMYVDHDWLPRGLLEDYTLDRFKQEIGLVLSDRAKGFRCRLTGPGVDSTKYLSHVKDRSFERFIKGVKLAVKNALRLTEPDASCREVAFNLVIEEWREGDQVADVMSDDVDDMSGVI